MKKQHTNKKVDFLDGALVTLMAAMLLLFGIGFLLLPQKSFSESENRMLAIWEIPTWQSVSDGSFSEKLGKIFRDQFPLRPALVATKAYGEILLGKRENNRILWGEEGYLMARNEFSELSVAEENLRAVADAKMTAVWIPRSADVMTEYLPSAYPSASANELYRMIGENGTVPWQVLSSAVAQGRQVYYRTDHHLTTEGAYLIYCSLGEKLGYSPLSYDEFDRQTVSEDFRGSADSAVGGIAPRADTIELFRYEGDADFRVIDRTTGEEREGFYDWSALEKKDQYSVFLGGNFAHLSISSSKEVKKPKLLLVKDSFANALIPFLAIHFDLEVVDLRYVTGSLWVEEYDCALILQGVDTLATDPSLKKLDFLQKKS